MVEHSPTWKRTVLPPSCTVRRRAAFFSTPSAAFLLVIHHLSASCVCTLQSTQVFVHHALPTNLFPCLSTPAFLPLRSCGIPWLGSKQVQPSRGHPSYQPTGTQLSRLFTAHLTRFGWDGLTSLVVAHTMLWGMEVKTGRAAPYVPPPEGQALHLVRATLDPAAADGARCVLRVQMDGGTALVVASLRAGVHESVALDLLLEEYAEFTITGDASVHLIGNLVAHRPSSASDESDDDDDDEAYVPSSEEMEWMVDGGWMDAWDSDGDEEEHEVESDEDDAWAKVAAHQRTNVVIEELDDENPVPSSLAGTNRSPSKALATEEAKTKKKKEKKKRNQAQTNEPEPLPQGSRPAKRSKESERNEKDAPDTKDRNGTQAVASDKPASTKKEQKKAKKQAKEDAVEDSPKAGLVQGSKHVRRYENGFEIVELHMGQPDGKLAQPGKKVEMRYVGKLKSNGRMFDQTKGKSTFKFRLGVGEVIKGWDVGVQGMRVGDKRRLTIPPQMAYGSSGVKGAIPPNATLTFDVELVHVW